MTIKFFKANKKLSAEVDKLLERSMTPLFPKEIKKVLKVLEGTKKEELESLLTSIISQKATPEKDVHSLKEWLKSGSFQDLRGRNIHFSKIIDLSVQILTLDAKINERQAKEKDTDNLEQDLKRKTNELLYFAEFVNRELIFK